MPKRFTKGLLAFLYENSNWENPPDGSILTDEVLRDYVKRMLHEEPGDNIVDCVRKARNRQDYATRINERDRKALASYPECMREMILDHLNRKEQEMASAGILVPTMPGEPGRPREVLEGTLERLREARKKLSDFAAFVKKMEESAVDLSSLKVALGVTADGKSTSLKVQSAAFDGVLKELGGKDELLASMLEETPFDADPVAMAKIEHGIGLTCSKVRDTVCAWIY